MTSRSSFSQFEITATANARRDVPEIVVNMTDRRIAKGGRLTITGLDYRPLVVAVARAMHDDGWREVEVVEIRRVRETILSLAESET